MSDAARKYEIDEAREHAYSIPIEEIDVGRGELFKTDTMWPYFERLRKEAPVHYCATNEEFGPYWSVTKYNDIMAVDTNHQVFSSEDGITLRDQDEDFKLPMFIAMDPPKHDDQRKVVSPIVAPANLAKLESTIRERAGKLLDAAGHAASPSTGSRPHLDRADAPQMLATLFDFPFEDRRLLTLLVGCRRRHLKRIRHRADRNETALRPSLSKCAAYFTRLCGPSAQRREPGNRPHLDAARTTREPKDMIDNPMEYLGNLILLIVGGNDTTRNSITGGLYALNKFPEQYRKLQANPSLIPNMVAEIIRWQTPLAHMRRTALQDIELGGKQIKKGDKVAMWYVSGNRDEDVISTRRTSFVIDRERRAPASFLRLRHSPLHRQPCRRNAAARSSGKRSSSAGRTNRSAFSRSRPACSRPS